MALAITIAPRFTNEVQETVHTLDFLSRVRQFGGDERLLYTLEMGASGGGAHTRGQYRLTVSSNRIRIQRVNVIACSDLTRIQALYFISCQ